MNISDIAYLQMCIFSFETSISYLVLFLDLLRLVGYRINK